LELKYRSDRTQQADNALKCIKFKKYPERSLNILRNKYSDLYKDIEEVYEVGIALSTAGKLYEIDFVCETFSMNAYDLEKHFTLNFIKYMRRNLKRFVVISENLNIYIFYFL